MVSEWGHGQGWWRLGGHCGLLEGALTVQGCPAARGIHHRERPGPCLPSPEHRLDTAPWFYRSALCSAGTDPDPGWLLDSEDPILTSRALLSRGQGSPDPPPPPDTLATGSRQAAGPAVSSVALVAVTLRLHILSGQAAGLCPCR